MQLSALVAIPLLSFSLVGLAEAAPSVDLRVTLSAPSVHVYEAGTYAIQISNTGNRNASGVALVINLPRTQTSPQVALMGTLGARDSRCAYANQRLTCAIGALNRNTSTTVSFTLTMPYRTTPLVIAATATSSGPEATPANNSLSHTAQLALYPNVITSGSTITRVCGGTNLSSFFECELFPSSISQFSSTLNADHSVSISDPGYTGSWWMTGTDLLHIEYTDGATIDEVDLRSVGGGCFEGVMTGGGWTAVHEVCVY